MATWGHQKLSKVERKLIKRQTKAQATLMKHDGISASLCPTTVSISIL